MCLVIVSSALQSFALFRGPVGAVRPYLLEVLLVQYLLKHLAVMHGSRCDIELPNQLALLIHLLEFVRLFLPCLSGFSLLGLVVLLLAIPLLGYFHNGCIDNLVFLRLQTGLVQEPIEILEQRIDPIALG